MNKFRKIANNIPSIIFILGLFGFITISIISIKNYMISIFNEDYYNKYVCIKGDCPNVYFSLLMIFLIVFLYSFIFWKTKNNVLDIKNKLKSRFICIGYYFCMAIIYFMYYNFILSFSIYINYKLSL